MLINFDGHAISPGATITDFRGGSFTFKGVSDGLVEVNEKPGGFYPSVFNLTFLSDEAEAAIQAKAKTTTKIRDLAGEIYEAECTEGDFTIARLLEEYVTVCKFAGHDQRSAELGAILHLHETITGLLASHHRDY